MDDTIGVIMSTYNGEKYLIEQIESILNQSGVNIRLYVRDDGSTDKTKEILNDYSKKGKLSFYCGENIGAGKSFVDLLFSISDIDYIAFSDQDDYWKPDKLLTALQKLKGIEGPAFYNSVVEIVDNKLQSINKIYGEKKIYNFITQVARSNVIGCTMLINRQLIELLKTYRPTTIAMHDQWISIVCKSVGGTEIKDNTPQIMYRQHNNNVIGAETDIRKRINKSSICKNNCIRYKQAEQLFNGFKTVMGMKEKEQLMDILKYKISIRSRLNCIFAPYNTGCFIYNCLIRYSFIRGTF